MEKVENIYSRITPKFAFVSFVAHFGGLCILFSPRGRYFGSLEKSMLTLFQVSTLDTWIEIMYINMYGCDLYGYGDIGWPRTQMCTNPNAKGFVAVLFFVSFTIIRYQVHDT